MTQLNDDDIEKLLSFVSNLVDDVDESCSVLLGRGLERSQDWDDKLNWKLTVEFSKLREIKALIDKWREWDEDDSE